MSFIIEYVNVKGIIIDDHIEDIGSGLNYNRKKWNKLLDEVEAGKIKQIFATYKDCFARFGFDWFEHFCSKHDTKIIVLNNLETSPDEEMVDDLISVVHVFSCRLYGLRRYSKLIKQDLNKVGESSDHKAARQGFKMDQAKIKDGYLFLEKPKAVKEKWTGFKLRSAPLSEEFGTISFYKEKGKYYVAIPFKLPEPERKPQTNQATGVDLNVGHFNYQDGQCLVLPKTLERSYEKIKHYQRQLAKKRIVNGKVQGTKSKKYLKTIAKLQATYQRVNNIQKDLMHKFTTKLVNDYDQIVIEDLAVKGMLMSHVASKGMHRSMFGLFRRLLTYKCEWYGRELIVANKLYPSTQRCAACGLVKKGDEKITLIGNKKHGTKHNEYVCYNPNCPNYNKAIDRDENAMANLTLLAKCPDLNKAL